MVVQERKLNREKVGERNDRNKREREGGAREKEREGERDDGEESLRT